MAAPTSVTTISPALLALVAFAAFGVAPVSGTGEGSLQEFRRMLKKGDGNLDCCIAEALDRLGLTSTDVLPVVSGSLHPPIRGAHGT